MDKTSIGKDETVLITGASSGIGEALAGCFAQGGFDLVLVARSVDKLESLAARLARQYKVKVWVEPADLSMPDAARKLVAAMKRRRRAIDVLVNNAGVLQHGTFAAMTPARHQQLIDLNVSGLTAMLAHFVPPMVTRGHGRILNVASIAAFQPIPTLATYAATKAFVLSLSESLSEELKGSGVSITALCPGITATNMLSTAASARSQLTKLPGFLIGDVDKVAIEGYEACIRGDVIKVPGAINLAAILAGRATPKWLLRRVSGTLGRKTI
ncbi:MAG: SDR family NAD(P)-dependent oxidoreductase [Betaproteobacteria bacterium]